MFSADGEIVRLKTVALISPSDVYSDNYICDYLSCKNGACVPLDHRCMFTIDKYGFMTGCRDATHLAKCGMKFPSFFLCLGNFFQPL